MHRRRESGLGLGETGRRSAEARKRVKAGPPPPVSRGASAKLFHQWLYFDATASLSWGIEAAMKPASNEHTITTDRETLSAFCDRLAKAAFVTVDTEFMRESTFWAQLCLIQMAGPGEAAIIDPFAAELDLSPFYRLMADEKVLKVFHAARQDIEIFVHQAGAVPHPIFDTQIAAMVCGYGDQVSYDQLVYRVTGDQIDKSSRFTDWSHRPLSEKQTA